MSVNLLEAVQKQLNYQPLQKIDPNTQEVVADKSTPDEDRFSQAAIPAAIISLYKFSHTEDGAVKILYRDAHSDWPSIIFGEKKNELFKKIAEYSSQPEEDCIGKTSAIFSAAVSAIKEHIIPTDANITAVKDLLAGQRNTVLPYLPAEMQLGKLLDDSTLDDRTNKMEGPISNLMHSIGNIFSTSDDEIKKPD